MRLIFLGPPASGKGTLSQMLAGRLDLNATSVGFLLRQHVTQGTEIGRDSEAFMRRSALVPDELVEELMSQWLDSIGEASWILDGFPRTLNQAMWLSKEMKDRKISLDRVVSLEVSRDLLLDRIRERLQCSACGHTTAHSLVGEKLLCPECHGELVSRQDDAEETFLRRYEEFILQTLPVVDYYHEQGHLLSVRAEGEAEEIASSICEQLGVRF